MMTTDELRDRLLALMPGVPAGVAYEMAVDMAYEIQLYSGVPSASDRGVVRYEPRNGPWEPFLAEDGMRWSRDLLGPVMPATEAAIP